MLTASLHQADRCVNDVFNKDEDEDGYDHTKSRSRHRNGEVVCVMMLLSYKTVYVHIDNRSPIIYHIAQTRQRKSISADLQEAFARRRTGMEGVEMDMDKDADRGERMGVEEGSNVDTCMDREEDIHMVWDRVMVAKGVASYGSLILLEHLCRSCMKWASVFGSSELG